MQKSSTMQEQTAASIGVAQQPADLQADFFASLQQRAFPKLSSLELQEMRVLRTWQ